MAELFCHGEFVSPPKTGLAHSKQRLPACPPSPVSREFGQALIVIIIVVINDDDDDDVLTSSDVGLTY